MFNKNLKYLRLKSGRTQQELAELLDRKISSISEWESGKYTPRIGVLNDIASIFNVNIDDLMNVDLEDSGSQIEQNNAILEKKKTTQEYPVLFTPDQAALAHQFVQQVQPLGFGGIDIYNLTDEQAVTYANIIRKSLEQAQESIELQKLRDYVQNKED